MHFASKHSNMAILFQAIIGADDIPVATSHMGAKDFANVIENSVAI